MKLKSLIMFSAAALAFAACSNDEENAMSQGDAVVRVQISTEDVTRALATPTPGEMGAERAVVVNSVTLELSATKGEGTQTFYTSKEKGSAIDQANQAVFTGVRLPSTLSVSINKGEAIMELAEVQTGLAAPMYASKAISASDYDADSKTYTVELEPQHKTALLEFSGIKHVHVDDGACSFADGMIFDGLFMNNFNMKEDGTDVLTYYNSWAEANVDANPLKDAIGASWHTPNAVWPATGSCYAYNVFPSLPILTLCYSKVAAAPGAVWVDGSITGAGYATVDEYQLVNNTLTAEQKSAMGADESGVIRQFKKGYVYRFVDLQVPDEAIGNTVTGGEDVKVVAKIEVIPWILVSGQVTWN